jgi:sulfur relay (sulfurtransferase) complex TusBCD TusD component (DsrE family)
MPKRSSFGLRFLPLLDQGISGISSVLRGELASNTNLVIIAFEAPKVSAQMRSYLHFPSAIRKLCTVALALFMICTTVSCQEDRAQPDRLWFWFGDCPNPKQMQVEIVVDGQTVYRSRFHACRLARSQRVDEAEQKTMYRFYFSDGHTFQNEYHASKNDKIEGNIWEAGADPNDILLGVSFATRDQILINTVHIVKPGRPTQMTLDRGVLIKTYPVAAKKTNTGR